MFHATDENLDLEGGSTWSGGRSEWNRRRDYGLCTSDKGTGKGDFQVQKMSPLKKALEDTSNEWNFRLKSRR